MAKVRCWSYTERHREFEKTALKTAKKLLHAARPDGALDIHIVGSGFMDKNVLAFPAPKGFPRPDVEGEFLGEIYLNPDYIKKHREDFVYMLVHGFLHLLGYDHMRKPDRIKMDRKERGLMAILRRLNQ